MKCVFRSAHQRGTRDETLYRRRPRPCQTDGTFNTLCVPFYLRLSNTITAATYAKQAMCIWRRCDPETRRKGCYLPLITSSGLPRQRLTKGMIGPGDVRCVCRYMYVVGDLAERRGWWLSIQRRSSQYPAVKLRASLQCSSQPDNRVSEDGSLAIRDLFSGIITRTHCIGGRVFVQMARL